MATAPGTAEQRRLVEARDGEVPWRKWGPYLSERQWGTVREDYSDNGDAWMALFCPPSLTRACSAGTRTGEGRSGSR